MFVPWYEIDIYTAEVPDAEALWKSMSDYERWLWQLGCTRPDTMVPRETERIPVAPSDAGRIPIIGHRSLANTGSGVFAPTLIDTLRARCSDSLRAGRTIHRIATASWSHDRQRFVADPCGHLKVWSRPRHGIDRYVVSVDIGGRTPRPTSP